ncbi:MAG: hypothetical protein M3383_08100 [Actinomycetota bacterium]|nr:hypothetical protein [Actinomycetota bacterium]
MPLPALAVDDDGESAAATTGLTVSAALDLCGVADSAILCKIDASWSGIEHADTYMISVTRPDGSVIDFGSTGAAMTPLWVPYAGPGSYTITVEAWGTPPQAAHAEPELIARARATSAPAATTAPEEPTCEEARAPALRAPAVEEPIDPATATIRACPKPPSPPSPDRARTSSDEGPESSSSEASG